MSKFNVLTEQVKGKIKPMHAVNNGPMRIGGGEFEYLKEAGIPYARLHDTGGAFGGHVYVDIANVFRDFDADPSDPNSYDFAFTDHLLSNLVANGTKPFYRLGSTIENYHRIKAYNIFPPKDNLKWAKICEGIIRHYNEGWANGFKYDMEYWEIWNEPDNYPEIENNPMWKGTKEQFFELYYVAANYLKEKFPHLKIGGYGSCGFYKVAQIEADPNANVSPRVGYFVTFFEEFLTYITSPEHKAPLDFFSWHSYADVTSNRTIAEYARTTLDKFGFTKTEHMLNEWNSGPYLRGTLRDAANIAANMISLHYTSVDMLMYYDWRLNTNFCGVFNPLDKKPYKAFYSFKAFNQLYRLGSEVKIDTDEPEENQRVFALAAKDDLEAAIMLVNVREEAVEVQISFDKDYDLEGAEAMIIDQERTYEAVKLENGKITLSKDAVLVVNVKAK